MPRGAAVLAYHGKRGVTWRIKYVDAAGVQQMETVGAERDGVTRKQAEAELRARLVRVEKKGYRRPRPLTLTEYAELWFEEGKARRNWKPLTRIAYRTILDHLEDVFGNQRLGAIRPRDVAGYIREALKTYAPRTVQHQLQVLHDVYQTAIGEELVESNPVVGVERPRAPRNHWRILEPAEVPRIAAAFTDDRWRRLFLTLTLTGLRRSEVRRLRWRHLNLLEGTLRVEESKSEEGERLIALPPRLVDELGRHFSASNYRADDDLVFAHPERGSALDAGAYGKAPRRL